MRRPGRPRPLKEETARWLEKAGEDLSDAAYNLEGERFSTASFLAQQAAEKALKAVLIEREGKFPRIHDLKVLAAAAKTPEHLRARLRPLSEAYVAQRYPDVAHDLDHTQAEGMLRLSEEVVAWCRASV